MARYKKSAKQDTSKPEPVRLKQYLTVPQAADQTGLCDSTIRKLCYQRHIGYNKIGSAIRIPQEELDAFMARNMVAAVTSNQASQ